MNDRKRLTSEEEKAAETRGTCPICGAEEGETCRRDGKPLGSGKIHAGRLRANIDTSSPTPVTGPS